MGDAQHTAEPWEVYPLPMGNRGIRGEKGGYITHILPRETGWIEDEANAARIVACVNACVGLKNPAAAINALREELAYAVQILRDKGCPASVEGIEKRVGRHGITLPKDV